jgi:hypothetical protein
MLRALVPALLLALALAVPAQATRTVALDAADAPHAFVVGSDGALYHAPPGGFLERLGGENLRREPVAVVRTADGRLAVFARGTDDALYSASESTPGGLWSAWVPIGTALAGPPDAIKNADDRLEVFARGLDGAVWHAEQTTSGWSDWLSLGGTVAGEPAAILDHQERIVLFARGNDDDLWTASQDGSVAGWTAWTPVDGPIASDPAPARTADGRLEVFARGADGKLWNAAQTVPGGPFSATSLDGTIVGTPAGVLDGQGRLQVFALTSDNALWQTYEDPAGGPWVPWRSLGGQAGGPGSSRPAQFTGDPAVVRDGGGRLHVVVPGADNVLFSAEQFALGPLDWRAFTSLGSATPAPPPPPAAVVPPPVPTPVVPLVIPALKTINVTLAFSLKGKPSRTSTRLKRLSVTNVPAGATVTATCAKGCTRKSVVVRHAYGTVALDRIGLTRAFKVGTRIRVEVRVSGMIGAVRTLTVRPKKRPTVATRCLRPGAATESLC